MTPQINLLTCWRGQSLRLGITELTKLYWLSVSAAHGGHVPAEWALLLFKLFILSLYTFVSDKADYHDGLSFLRMISGKHVALTICSHHLLSKFELRAGSSLSPSELSASYSSQSFHKDSRSDSVLRAVSSLLINPSEWLCLFVGCI